jgi:hypothetical protein
MMAQRSDLVARHCTNCGARVEAEPVNGRVTCHYCGQSFDVPADPPPPQRVIVIAPRIAAPAAPQRAAAGVSIVGVMGAILVLVLAGYFATQKGAPGTTLHVPGLPAVTLTGGGIATDFMWDTVAGPPIPAQVGSGPAEGFVGRIRARGGGDELWAAAFEGAKLGQAWKAGPFGTYSQGYQSTFVGVVGHDAVVTDYRANLHVYDVATGRETRTLKLTDRAKSMCAATDGKPHVWIELSDEKNVLVDADAGTATPAPRPAWCPDRSSASDDCRGWLKRGPPRLTCKGAEAAPKVNGFEAANVVEDGDLAVALGKKRPGTAVPMAVGFDPKTRAVKWEQPIASGDQAAAAESGTISIMDAMAAGRFVAPYELTSKGWHFTAFDARSGQRLWDVALQPLIGVDHPEGFSLSATRVYVMRTSSVEVYDAKTGTLVGIVGAV